MVKKPKEEKKTPLPKNKKKSKKKPAVPPADKTEKKLRQIIIVTDGNTFKIMKADVTPLEFKAICADIIKALSR